MDGHSDSAAAKVARPQKRYKAAGAASQMLSSILPHDILAHLLNQNESPFWVAVDCLNLYTHLTRSLPYVECPWCQREMINCDHKFPT